MNKRLIFKAAWPAGLLLSFFSHQAGAACTALPLTVTVTFGDLAVQRDIAIGTTLATATAAFGEQTVLICSSTTNYGNDYVSLFSTLSSYGSQVYDTNIDGVGIQITRTSNGDLLPSDVNWSFSGNLSLKDRTVTLIKTSSGAIGTGTLTTGELYNYQVTADSTVYKVGMINLTGTNTISSIGCTVDNTAISVSMGNQVVKSQFTGVGSTAAETAFAIPLTCDSGASVNLKLEAGAAGAYSASSGVLNLSSSDDSTVASGVGLQLLYNSSPVTLDTAMSIGTTSAEGSFSIPLVARYYQTDATVTSGLANANATFTMTYN